MARETVEDRRQRLRRAGDWLREQREARGLTQRQVADALGLDQVRVSAYERGLYEVDTMIARGIAKVLRLPEVDVWVGMERGLPHEAPGNSRAHFREELRRSGLFTEEQIEVAVAALGRGTPRPPSQPKRARNKTTVHRPGDSERKRRRGTGE